MDGKSMMDHALSGAGQGTCMDGGGILRDRVVTLHTLGKISCWNLLGFPDTFLYNTLKSWRTLTFLMWTFILNKTHLVSTDYSAE